MPSPGTFSFPPAKGMVHGVHGDAANPGIAAQPPGAARFSYGNIFMVQIANLSHGRVTL
jgi:hypothetical protein